MGKEWLSWVGGSGGNSRPKRAAGCIFHLFHFHFPSSHRHTSYPFLQEESTTTTTTTTGVEAPRNSLEDLNFPAVGVKMKTSKAKAVAVSSECDDYSPGTKTPSVVARLMGLDLLPQCSSPSTQIDAARSLPETPRTSSDVERHRLSLELTNKENAYDGCRRFKKDDSKRNRSVGLDITNIHKNSDQSKKISKIVEKVKQSNPPKVHNPRRVVTNQIPLKESKRVSRREDGFVGCRERNKTHNIKCKIGPPPTNLPPIKSQVEVSDGVTCSAQLSSKSYSQLQLRQDKTPATVSPCAAAATHGGVSPDIKMILKHTAIAKWDSPSQPINPAAGLSHRCERKLVFQLVDELLAEILTRHLKLKPWVPHFGGGSRLVEELCKKMGSFPAKKCEVLEDIDSLIEKDFCNGFWGGEEEMVSEIEGELVEWLVMEAVAVMGGDAAEQMVFVM